LPSNEVFVTLSGVTTVDLVRPIQIENAARPEGAFCADAMRFEMGVELAERLPKTAEVGVRHAVGALPSITPIGMDFQDRLAFETDYGSPTRTLHTHRMTPSV
jgi:hypothetical protein